MTDEELKAKYYQTLKRYNETFDEGFPNMPCSLDAEEQIVLMEECLRTGKPVMQDTSDGQVC